jgi:hypothetical protein
MDSFTLFHAIHPDDDSCKNIVNEPVCQEFQMLYYFDKDAKDFIRGSLSEAIDEFSCSSIT